MGSRLLMAGSRVAAVVHIGGMGGGLRTNGVFYSSVVILDRTSGSPDMDSPPYLLLCEVGLIVRCSIV